jgi:hypothetical protein
MSANAIEYESFTDFLARITNLVAPEELAENMQDYFREQVGNALSDIQTLIPWTRRFNVETFGKDGVEEFCAASVFQGPVGKITQLFAYRPGRDCKKLYYRRVTSAKIDCWIEAQRCVQCTLAPPPPNIYDTPYCNYVVLGETACAPPYLSGTEDDCRFLSLNDQDRMFAVGPDYKVYAAPRFPCGYTLFMQWQGVRRKWTDLSAVPVDQQLRECVINRVQKKIAMQEKDWTAMRAYDEEYTVCLRTLRFRYHDEQDPELERDCSAAIERMLPAFSALYAPSQIVEEVCISDSLGSGSGDDVLES